jgi:uncharacterized repeat protein (TIGR01451 family)
MTKRRGMVRLALVCAGLIILVSAEPNSGRQPTTGAEPPLASPAAAPTPSVPRIVVTEPSSPPSLPVSPPTNASAAAPWPQPPVAPRSAAPEMLPATMPPSNVSAQAHRSPTLPAGTPPKASPTAPPPGMPTVADESVAYAGAAEAVNSKQEPAVTMEWTGPTVVRVGQPGDYTLTVSNMSDASLSQVAVRVRVPAGMNAIAAEPTVVPQGDLLLWDLGTLAPKKDRQIQVRFVGQRRGDFSPQTSVTFTGNTTLKFRVREPRLVVKLAWPQKVNAGDTVPFTFTATNNGDGPAEQVRINAVLSEGLDHPQGRQHSFEIGTLAPGESRSVQVICTSRMGGQQSCECTAQADGNLKAQDRALVAVILPRLDINVAGPVLRYVDRKATYSFKVSNPSDLPASNVTIQDIVPAGFKVVSASDGGRVDPATRNVSWVVGDLAPGQAKEVKLEVQATTPGDFKHKAIVAAARGLKAEREISTRVEGVSSLLLEVMDEFDPIEVGAENTYEIRVANTGSMTESNVKLVCTLPPQLTYVSHQGPVRCKQEGKTLIFEPLPKLAPRTDAQFKIKVKATAAGDVRFKAQITSPSLAEPIQMMEATRIYADSPDGK